MTLALILHFAHFPKYHHWIILKFTNSYFMSDDRRIIHEITPLMGKDVLYIADRHKKEFTYPIHNHSVF